MPPAKGAQFNGKFKLVAQSDNTEEVMKFQGAPWLAIKAMKHSSKSKTLTIEDDVVTNDLCAAGVLHVIMKCPIVPSENARQHGIEKGVPNKMMGRDMVASCWWEGDNLVVFNHEPKTGMDMVFTHSLSEDAGTMTCTIRIVRGDEFKEGQETFKRV